MLQEKVTLLNARRRTLLMLLKISREIGDIDTIVAVRATLARLEYDDPDAPTLTAIDLRSAKHGS